MHETFRAFIFFARVFLADSIFNDFDNVFADSIFNSCRFNFRDYTSEISCRVTALIEHVDQQTCRSFAHVQKF